MGATPIEDNPADGNFANRNIRLICVNYTSIPCGSQSEKIKTSHRASKELEKREVQERNPFQERNRNGTVIPALAF